MIGVDLGTTYSVVAVRKGKGGISDVEVSKGEGGGGGIRNRDKE